MKRKERKEIKEQMKKGKSRFYFAIGNGIIASSLEEAKKLLKKLKSKKKLNKLIKK